MDIADLFAADIVVAIEFQRLLIMLSSLSDSLIGTRQESQSFHISPILSTLSQVWHLESL